MGIMDVLEELSGPEYDEPEVQTPEPEEETAVPVPEAEPVEEPEVTAEAPIYIDSPDPEGEPMPEKKRLTLRAEGIMALVAAFAAVLVGVLVVLCMPYFQAEAEKEDPQFLQQRHEAQWATEPVPEPVTEPAAETVPAKPTIPPDKNPYDRYDFQYNEDNYLVLQNVVSYPGVDVSAYQGDIDWEMVKASGIDFAIIRLGYRGYESGKLVEDAKARKNLEGAAAAGLKVGAYFFSQALNTKEVDEELEFVLDILGEQYLAMPLVLDWEIPTANARSARMDARTLTDLQLHFCKKVSDLGYKPMIYFNWHQSENLYYLHELEEYPFWLALYQDRMTYPWRVEMWQYTSSGRVPGIPGDVDINVYMPY